MTIRPLAVAIVLALRVLPAAASDTGKPDPGMLRAEAFAPALDAICGRGTSMSKGCDAIRARTIVDAASPPWRAIGRVNFASIRRRQHCTGTLVSERMVLTAAHCLYSVPRKSWIPPESLRFAAGYQRGQAVAQARVRRYLLDPVQDSRSRDFRGGVAQDWALLELDAPLGRELGYLPLAGAGDAAAPDARIRLAGYAGLRPHVLTVAGDCGRWTFLPGGGLAATTCSATPGDSGAPLLVARGDRLSVAGVFSTVAVTATGRPHSLAIPASVFAAALDAAAAE